MYDLSDPDFALRLTNARPGLAAVRRGRFAWCLPAVLLAGLTIVPAAQAQLGLPPALASYAAPLLAEWIETSRDQALAAGTQPVPPDILQALRGEFPLPLLLSVRYRVGSPPDSGLAWLALTYGDVSAMTLDNVVLFRDSHTAATDIKLWVHELTHIQQYQRWGVGGFAMRYVQDPAGVEQEAYTHAGRYAALHGSGAH